MKKYLIKYLIKYTSRIIYYIIRDVYS